MARQYRGCSKLVYAIVTETAESTTYGTVKELAPVKSISRDLASESEDVWADNQLQQKTYGGSKVTRSFDTTRIPAEVEAELLGNTIVTVGTTGNLKAYATDPNGNTRPYIAVGYALHDGDVDKPCEVVWAFKGKVNSITKAANTIDDGTGSEGQTIEIEFIAPRDKFTATGKRNLDIALPIDEATTIDIDDWFAQVVTPDNIATVLN